MVQHSAIDHTGITGAGGSVATDAIFDAKGDLAVGTGANTAAKLTVGANDTIPMADSGQATGIKWVAAATPTDQDYDDVAAAGTSDTFARGDHLHGMPSAGGGGTNPGVKVYNNAAQSIASGSEVVLTFNSEEYDDAAIHDAGAPTLLTVPTGMDGRWRFRASVSVAANATGSRSIGFRLNAGAGTYIRGGYKTWAPVSGTILTQTIEATINGLVAGDDITVFAFQNTGGNLNVGSGNSWEMTTFEAEFLGA